MLKKSIALGATTAGLFAGAITLASPALANTCVYTPTGPDVYAGVCADASIVDPTSNPGAAVNVAASVAVGAYGGFVLCTGYYTIGAEVDVSPVAVYPIYYVEGLPHFC